MSSVGKVASGIVIGIVAVIVAILVINNLGSVSQTINPTVTVNAVDVAINYDGATSGYLGATSQSISGFTVNAGSQESYTLTFYTSATLLTHSINDIFVDTSGFSISSESPALPYSFSPGSTITITIVLNAPSSTYNGVLELVVDTT